MTVVPTRRMEQSVFRTIVEMANEMDYHEKRIQNLKEVKRHIETIVRIPNHQPRLNTRVLRSVYAKPTKGHDHFTEPFQWKNREFRVAVYMEYERHQNNGDGRVREKGIITLSPQYKSFGNSWRDTHRLIWVRGEYHTLEEFHTILEGLTRGAVDLFWCHF